MSTNLDLIDDMRLLVILLLLSGPAFGQSRDRLQGKPGSLEECFEYLDAALDDTIKYTFKVFPEGMAVATSHDGLGTWVRNNFGLWRNSPLRRHFEQEGIFHADAMSTIILTSYHRRLNGEDLRLKEQMQSHSAVRRVGSKDSIFSRTNEDMVRQIEAEIEYFKSLFQVGDTVMIGIYAPEKRLFQTYATSVTGYAVIRDSEDMTAEIIRIRRHRRRIPEKNVGDIVKLHPMNVRLIPPASR